MASGHHTVVDVDFAYKTKSAGWTGTCEVVDQIVTGTTVLAGIWLAIIDVEFAVLTLETLGTLALIRTDEIFARCTILTWRRVAFIYLFLTVRAGVTIEAMTTMTIAYIFAGAIIAKTFLRHALSYGGIFA